MEIKNVGNSVQPITKAERVNKSNHTEAINSTKQNGVVVTKTEVAKMMAKISELGSDVPFNAEKVSDIKRNLDKVKISPEKIADALLDDVRFMLGKNR